MSVDQDQLGTFTIEPQPGAQPTEPERESYAAMLRRFGSAEPMRPVALCTGVVLGLGVAFVAWLTLGLPWPSAACAGLVLGIAIADFGKEPRR